MSVSLFFVVMYVSDHNYVTNFTTFSLGEELMSHLLQLKHLVLIFLQELTMGSCLGRKKVEYYSGI